MMLANKVLNLEFFSTERNNRPNFREYGVRGLKPLKLGQRIALVLIFAIAFALRAPYIGKGLPYFYDEDEAHHFNRIVNMVKTGDLNPHYFHKPSLHFYLRMPVVGIGFLWGVREGHLRSVQEINTRDSFGVGDYAFSASHPGIVKWNRAFSVFLSLTSVLLTFLIARRMSSDNWTAILAAAMVALSPGLIEGAATIGVDVVVGTLSLIAIYLALKLYDNFSATNLALCCIASGLAVSTKYNAFPILIIPLIACLIQSRFDFETLLAAAVLPWIGFLIGSPYILTSFPLFLDQFGYEVWHYGVAGHVNHMAEPGIEQGIFYLNWLGSYGVGIVALTLAALGAAKVVSSRLPMALTFLIFPTLYFLLMASQKANFTRNMHILVPFIAVLGALGAVTLYKFLPASRFRSWYLSIFTVLLFWQPLGILTEQSEANSKLTESRKELEIWITENGKKDTPIAVSGELQLARSALGIEGVSKIDELAIDPQNLKQFIWVVLSDRELSVDEKKILTLIKTIEGDGAPTRIVKNPTIKIYKRIA